MNLLAELHKYIVPVFAERIDGTAISNLLSADQRRRGGLRNAWK
jgi:hypothetical protein